MKDQTNHVRKTSEFSAIILFENERFYLIGWWVAECSDNEIRVTYFDVSYPHL